MNYNNIVKFYKNRYAFIFRDEFILVDKDGVYYYKQKNREWITLRDNVISWRNLKEITKAEFFTEML